MYVAERRCDSSPVDANATFDFYPNRWDKPAAPSSRLIPHRGRHE
jgi:hypothetical protein